ncbi:MAG: DUF3556 domain-containing protein [Aeromicrobium erythreum]
MGFKEGDFPPVDPAEFMQRPLLERVRYLAVFWGEYGFGTPKIVHWTYIAKLVVLYIGLGIAVITLTSGMLPWQVGEWWDQPIFYQKLILWTVLLESLGVAGSWGPISGHFKPMMGGILYWARVGTIRNPPWPTKVPFTSGMVRRPIDVALYLGYLAVVTVGIVLPGTNQSTIAPFVGQDNAGLVEPALFVPMIAVVVLLGLRDKVSFLATRPEQYVWAMLFATTLGFVDLIIALKMLLVSVWIGAGWSKVGHHFTKVVPAMICNTPWLTSKKVKKMMFKDYPRDMQPSMYAKVLAHGGGTLVEIGIPLLLLFTTSPTIALLGAIGMVCLHLFILSTFPLAAPLEWNLLFAFGAVALFVGFPNSEGFAIYDISEPWIAVLIGAGLMFFPVLGNLRPDLVSFLPSMRQYAGNWASAMWATAPGVEDIFDEKLNKSAKMQINQLAETYGKDAANVVMNQTLAWRSLHSHGGAFFTLLQKHLGANLDTYDVREAEFSWNAIGAFNFGDAHFHNAATIEEIQRICQLKPGQFIAVWVESQPAHRNYQEYQVIDAALGVIERGTYRTIDSANAQPGLVDGPIEHRVTWQLEGAWGHAYRAAEEPAAVVPEVATDAGSPEGPEVPATV